MNNSEKALVMELIDSSSSSPSDEETLQLFKVFGDNFRSSRNRVQNFMEDVVAKYTDEEFRNNFRVSRETAANITEQFANSSHFVARENPGGRTAAGAEVQCFVFLWFAGNKTSYREVSNLFNLSVSSVYKYICNFGEFLYDVSTEYIKMPSTADEKHAVSREFYKIAGINNVLGCIDGCYIYIRKPAHKIRSTYINRHGLLSLTLQGICDANKKFLDVFVGSPSKIHDSRIFQLSFISKEISAICGREYHLLGDAAYPIREYLLTPYKDYGNLTPRQVKYNKKHCQTRVKIENCFGLLKQRFRQLTRLDFFNVKRMCKFCLGCSVLHNLCIMEGDLWVQDNDRSVTNADFSLHEQTVPDINNEDGDLRQSILQHRGELKRQSIVETL